MANSPYLSFSADPLSNMVLTFSSKEDAIAFAEKNGKEKLKPTFICNASRQGKCCLLIRTKPDIKKDIMKSYQALVSIMEKAGIFPK